MINSIKRLKVEIFGVVERWFEEEGETEKLSGREEKGVEGILDLCRLVWEIKSKMKFDEDG